MQLLFLFLGLCGVFLGVKGFTREGIQVGKEQFITGYAAKAIGLLCLVFGLGCLGLGIYGVFNQIGSTTDPYGR